MSAEENAWRTSTFRQSVVAKIDEAIQRAGVPITKNSNDMEDHVFQKAKTREEYLGFVARLILHVREMSSKKGGGAGGAQGMQQDPINALQTLARTGTGNNQMMGLGPGQGSGMVPQTSQSATNLLQTLNQRPGQQLPNMQGLQNKMPDMGMVPSGPQVSSMVQMQGQMQGGQMRLQMTGQIPNQMLGAMGGQMPVQMPGQMPGQMPVQMPGQMPGQIPGQMTGQLPGQIGQMSHMGQMQNQRKVNEGLMMGAQNSGFPVQRANQFFRQTPSPTAPSPVGLGTAPPSNQMAASSPALVPSPTSQLTPISAPQRSAGMAPSPSSSLNTPGQAVPTPSPCSSMQEDQVYRDKVRQLSKYIEPLRRMINKMGNDDVEKLSKMKKLLEILSNPSKRMPLETLLKCEVVLEKLDFKRGEGSVTLQTALPGPKEVHIFSPLLEAVSSALQSPVANHTFQRTFGPCLEALFGPEIKMLPPPLKKKKIEEPPSDIPDVLQGEIARLDQRFKVSLDPTHQPGSRSVQLLCWLDDKHLPCVPPVSVSVPEDYPRSPPSCHMAPHEYSSTQFLSAVQKALTARIHKLPSRFSVSQLLDTWEMSVRQASAPVYTPASAATVLMGL